MSLPNQNKIRDAVRRGTLTPDEEADAQACLARHPELRAEWEEEVELNLLLSQVPDVPVSSNFTARAVEAARQSGRAPSANRFSRFAILRGWLPKLATIGAVGCLGLVSYHQHQLAARRELARNLVEVSRLASGTSLELMQNFEAIQRLNQVPLEVDRELIAALQ